MKREREREKGRYKVYYIWVKVDDLNENKLWRVFLRSLDEETVMAELARCVRSWGEMNTLLMETISFDSSSEVNTILGGKQFKASTLNPSIVPLERKRPIWTRIRRLFRGRRN